MNVSLEKHTFALVPRKFDDLTNRQTDTRTDRLIDRRRTKWSLCASFLACDTKIELLILTFSKHYWHLFCDISFSVLMYIYPKWFSMLTVCELKKFTTCIFVHSTLIMPWSFDSVHTLFILFLFVHPLCWLFLGLRDFARHWLWCGKGQPCFTNTSSLSYFLTIKIVRF